MLSKLFKIGKKEKEVEKEVEKEDNIENNLKLDKEEKIESNFKENNIVKTTEKKLDNKKVDNKKVDKEVIKGTDLNNKKDTIYSVENIKKTDLNNVKENIIEEKNNTKTNIDPEEKIKYEKEDVNLSLKARDMLSKRKEKYEKEEKEKENKKGFFKNLKDKLLKSREGLFKDLKNFFTGKTVIDDEMYEELEELLIQSDIGMEMTLKIVDNLQKEVKKQKVTDPEKVYDVLKFVLSEFLIKEENHLNIVKGKLNVILVIGVNGVGKTTTIGKIAAKLQKEGKKVVVGAADTFRAAAIEQLEEWGERANVDVIKHSQGSDPGAVVYDTLNAAKNRGYDVAIIDTAGRLHNKNNLMKELEKINKIIKNHIGEESYESILVLDGTTGQNGLSQAKAFNEITNLTGFILTKLDGTSKGGIIFSVSEELKKPVKFIGVGEGVDDLREFNADEFISAIFE